MNTIINNILVNQINKINIKSIEIDNKSIENIYSSVLTTDQMLELETKLDNLVLDVIEYIKNK